MPSKYPGGYTIIDLGGMNIDVGDDPVAIPVDKAFQLIEAVSNGKPVYITNLSIGGNGVISPFLLETRFFSTNDYAYAMWWDSTGLPFEQLLLNVTDIDLGEIMVSLVDIS